MDFIQCGSLLCHRHVAPRHKARPSNIGAVVYPWTSKLESAADVGIDMLCLLVENE